MVDPVARKQFAEILRHFGSGVMTVDEFLAEPIDDVFPFHDDLAISLFWNVAWCSFDDFKTERLRGRWQLTGENRKNWCRMILFLQTDREYLWPKNIFRVPFYALILLRVLTFLGLQSQGAKLREQLYQDRMLLALKYGEPDVWPFLTRSEYDNALAHPKYLTRLSTFN